MTTVLSRPKSVTVAPDPYTKIEFIQRDLGVSRLTASKYLEALTADGFLHKERVGWSNCYINVALSSLLTREEA